MNFNFIIEDDQQRDYIQSLLAKGDAVIPLEHIRKGFKDVHKKSPFVIVDINALENKSDRTWLSKLGMYESVTLTSVQSDDAKRLAKDYGIFDFSRFEIGQVRDKLRHEFYRGQSSTKILSYHTVNLSPKFVGEAERKGVVAYRVKGNFDAGEGYHTLFKLTQGDIPLSVNERGVFYNNQPMQADFDYQIELDANMAGIPWRLVFHFYDEQHHLINTQIADAEHQIVRSPKLSSKNKLVIDYDVFLQTLSFIDEEITFKGVNITLHRPDGYLVAGDTHIHIDETDEDVYYYFKNPTPGRKPGKLIVFFSGYRAWNRRFELAGRLGELKEPFIAVTDFRARGGAFYLNKYGTTAYSDTLEAEILKKLRELGLTRHDLVFSGWSMGSTAAIYYGARMGAGAIFAMKVIISLGTFTRKVNLSNDIGEMWIMEARRYLAGRVSEQDTAYLDGLVWNQLRQHRSKDSRFYIFTLQDDEYDGQSTAKLAATLRELNVYGDHFWLRGRHAEKTEEAFDFFAGRFMELRDRIYAKVNDHLS